MNSELVRLEGVILGVAGWAGRIDTIRNPGAVARSLTTYVNDLLLRSGYWSG